MHAQHAMQPVPGARPDRPRTDLLQGLSLACRFLGMLFTVSPEPAFLEDLHRQGLLEAWPLPETADAGQGLALMKGFLSLPGREAKAGRDYTELFIGPDQPLMQWESVWTTRDKLLFDEPTMAVRAFYARHGVAAPGPEADDHIALELTFLGELLERAVLAADKEQEDETEGLVQEAAAFHAEHLSRWAASFVRQMRDRAATDFYRGAALLCRATLEHMETVLGSSDGSRT